MSTNHIRRPLGGLPPTDICIEQGLHVLSQLSHLRKASEQSRDVESQSHAKSRFGEQGMSSHGSWILLHNMMYVHGRIFFSESSNA